MPTQIGSLFVSLTADVQPYAQAMARAQSATTSASRGIAKEAGVAEKSVQSFWNSAGSSSSFRPYSLIAVSRAFDNAADRAGLLRGTLLAATSVFGGFLGALSTNVILRYADSYTSLNNQIRVVADSTEDASARFSKVQETAQRSRSSLEATALLYSRIQKAAPAEPPDAILRYVETIQKALTLGGATAQEARSAAIQFSQAIASNRLSGDEMRAILETPLGLELAKGLGVTIGKMREMGTQGDLTAGMVLGALGKIAGSIDQKFARAVLTLDQALTQVDNQLTVYLGQVNQTYGVTALLAKGILGFGNNLESILPTIGAVGAGLAAMVAGRGIATLGGGLIGAVKTQAKEARDRVADLRAQVGSLQQDLVGAGAKRSDIVSALKTQGPTAFADGGATKALQRAQAEVEATREKTLKAFQDMQKGQRDLGAITAQVSPRAAKLTDDIAQAEQRVVENLAKQAQLRRELVSARASETSALALQTTTGVRLQAANQAIKERTSLERQLTQTEAAIGKDRDTIAAKEVQVSQLVAQADQKSADQRVAAAKKVEQLKAIYQDARLTFGVAGLDLNDARVAAAASGDQNARRALEEQNSRMTQLRNVLQPVQANLVGAERAATAFGIASGFVARQASSIIGLFGGPWGIAITGALALLGFLGIRAQEEAQRIANAEKTIGEALERAGRSNDDSGTRARQSVIQITLDNYSKSIKQVQEEFDRLREKITSEAASGNIAAGLSGGLLAPVDTSKVSDLIAKLRDGRISLDDFKQQMTAVGKIEGLKPLVDQALQLANQLDRAAQAIDRLKFEAGRLGPRGPNREAYGDVPPDDDQTIKKRGELEFDVRQSQRRAVGMDAETKAYQFLNNAAKDGIFLSSGYVIQKFKEIEANDKTAQSLKRAQAAAEAFQEKLNEFQQTAQGAFLTDVDRAVLNASRRLKNAQGLMANYIAGIKSGDLSKVDPRLLQYRQGELTLKSAESARQIVEQYGMWSQVAPLAKQKQEELNIAVEKGAITATQAKIAYADFLSQFGNYKWINNTADAFGTFAEEAVGDFSKIGTAFENLMKAIQKIAIQELIGNPIRNVIKALIASLSGGGAPGVNLGSIGQGVGNGISKWLGIGGTSTPSATAGAPLDLSSFMTIGRHGGGDVGPWGFTTKGMGGDWAGVPKFHSGLASDEFKAVLRRGEKVLTEGMADRTTSVIGGLAARAAPRPPMQVNIHNHAGADVKTQESGNDTSGMSLDIILDKQVGSAMRRPGSETAAALRERGLRPALARR